MQEQVNTLKKVTEFLGSMTVEGIFQDQKVLELVPDTDVESLRSIIPIASRFFRAWHQLNPIELPASTVVHVTHQFDDYMQSVNRLGRINVKEERGNLDQAFRDRLAPLRDKFTAVHSGTAYLLTYLQSQQFEERISEKLQSLEEVLDQKFQKLEEGIYPKIQPALRAAEKAEETMAAEIDAAHILRSDVEKMAAQVRSLSEKAGIAKQAEFFNDEADNHRKSSWVWIGIMFLVILAAGAYLLNVLEPGLRSLTATSTSSEMVRVVLPRLLAFSAIYFALIWAARNFAASRHNFIVNKHRALALSTFRSFADSTNDPTIRNAILLQATTAIFSGQASGYLKDEVVPQEKSSIVEIFRDITGGKT